MTDKLRKSLDRLADNLLSECNGVSDLSTSSKIDIFKAVAQYYLGCDRAEAKKKPIPEDQVTFETIVKRLGNTVNTDGGTA